MFRYIILLYFIQLFSTTITAQTVKSDTCTIYTDSIVYEIDTIKSIDTIEHLVYGAPTDYNVIGIQSSAGRTWISATNHQNSQIILGPELFANFNRNHSLFSVGIQYYSTTEKVGYSTKNTKTYDTTYQKKDTIFGNHYQKLPNGTLVTYYDTAITVKTYHKKDTLITHSSIQSQSTLRFISIPLRYGYYINQGYVRINFGLAIVPTFLLSKITARDSFLIDSKKRLSCLIQPTIEVTYWLYTHIFLHFSCSDQQSIIQIATTSNHKAPINSILANIGISFVFFDKKRE
jgi:hypothetical protein